MCTLQMASWLFQLCLHGSRSWQTNRQTDRQCYVKTCSNWIGRIWLVLWCRLITQHWWRCSIHTWCELSSNLFLLLVLLFDTYDLGPAGVIFFFTWYWIPGVCGREAINCSSRGTSLCRIKVVSGAAGLLQPNDIRVFNWLSDASESSGQFNVSPLVGMHLQSLTFPEISSTTADNSDCEQNSTSIYKTSKKQEKDPNTVNSYGAPSPMQHHN